MFFDNLPLEMTCSKCGKQINETVKWLKAESRKCPFCNTLVDTTEFRRGIDEATNRTHEMLRNLQESLKSVKIKIKLYSTRSTVTAPAVRPVRKAEFGRA